MPEVHRYQVVTMLSMAGATIGYDPHGPDVVMASDFDNATRLFLDAAERCVASERREKELQRRLTAADERNDSRDSEIFAQVQSALRRSFSLGQIYWQQADSDSTCQQNKSDQTMEVQEQHILNVLKSLSAALKPAEGVGDDTTLEEDREDFKKVFVRINTKQGQSISLADMIARYEKKP